MCKKYPDENIPVQCTIENCEECPHHTDYEITYLCPNCGNEKEVIDLCVTEQDCDVCGETMEATSSTKIGE
jgi:uncharacterized protein (DUF983 family)